MIQTSTTQNQPIQLRVALKALKALIDNPEDTRQVISNEDWGEIVSDVFSGNINARAFDGTSIHDILSSHARASRLRRTMENQ